MAFESHHLQIEMNLDRCLLKLRRTGVQSESVRMRFLTNYLIHMKNKMVE